MVLICISLMLVIWGIFLVPIGHFSVFIKKKTHKNRPCSHFWNWIISFVFIALVELFIDLDLSPLSDLFTIFLLFCTSFFQTFLQLFCSFLCCAYAPNLMQSHFSILISLAYLLVTYPRNHMKDLFVLVSTSDLFLCVFTLLIFVSFSSLKNYL